MKQTGRKIKRKTFLISKKYTSAMKSQRLVVFKGGLLNTTRINASKDGTGDQNRLEIVH